MTLCKYSVAQSQMLCNTDWVHYLNKEVLNFVGIIEMYTKGYNNITLYYCTKKEKTEN